MWKPEDKLLNHVSSSITLNFIKNLIFLIIGMYDLQERVGDYNASGDIALQPDITERLVATAHSGLEIMANLGSDVIDAFSTSITELLGYASVFGYNGVYARKGHTRGRRNRGARKDIDRRVAGSEVEKLDEEGLKKLLKLVRGHYSEESKLERRNSDQTSAEN